MVCPAGALFTYRDLDTAYSISRISWVPISLIFLKMAYRKRYMKKRRVPMRALVKRSIMSLAETKVHASQAFIEPTLASFQTTNQVLRFNPLEGIVAGPQRDNRVGSSIQLRGLRFEMTYDNSASLSTIPVYCTTVVLLVRSQEDPADKLFTSDGSTVGISLPTTFGSQADKGIVHMQPLNNTEFRVLHKSSIRLGSKGEPDMPGPRYAQRLAWLPMNQKIVYNDTNSIITQPNIVVLSWCTNPTQVTQTDTTAKFLHRIDYRVYYKDL